MPRMESCAQWPVLRKESFGDLLIAFARQAERTSGRWTVLLYTVLCGCCDVDSFLLTRSWARPGCHSSLLVSSGNYTISLHPPTPDSRNLWISIGDHCGSIFPAPSTAARWPVRAKGHGACAYSTASSAVTGMKRSDKAPGNRLSATCRA